MRDCILHGYTEKSARHKLERHRHRGDYTVSMLWHDECQQWHVEQFPGDVCPDCNGRGCHYDSHWRAGGTPGVCHRCQSTGFVNQRIAAAEQETP
jgi:DnaJ-class molecular chaperone